jgi:hypothetical protein
MLYNKNTERILKTSLIQIWVVLMDVGGGIIAYGFELENGLAIDKILILKGDGLSLSLNIGLDFFSCKKRKYYF